MPCKKDKLFHYFNTTPSIPLGQTERQDRSKIMSIFHNNVINHALKLLNKYLDSYKCWQALKACYENNFGIC
jgi:flagellar biosynthesis regulator FlbT